MELTKKENQKEIETAMVAVGIVLLIAGVKHGLATLVEQWRALVFLFLNLLLLTILFTSLYSNPTKPKLMNSKDKIKKKNVKEKKMKRSSCKNASTTTTNTTTSWPMQVEDLFRIEETLLISQDLQEKKDEIAFVGVANVIDDNEDDEVDVDEPQVSKEELNARVESFILMFRQQLALDAKERSTQFYQPQVR